MDEKASRLHGLSVGGGAPLFGGNAYYLLPRASTGEEGFLAEVQKTFQDARSLGLRTLRIWAFNDGAEAWQPFQTAPGLYRPEALNGLDYIVNQAATQGCQVILCLTNYFHAYGGAPKYCEWAGLPSSPPDAFYTDPRCRDWFAAYIHTVLGRVNSLDGIPYRYHPGIAAVDLMNEPRCPSDPSGRTFLSWLAQMTRVARRVAPSLPLTVGLEGFDDVAISSTPASHRGSGVPWLLAAKLLDFASIHIWPDQWLDPGQGQEPGPQQLAWVRRWILDHSASLGRTCPGTPLVVTEFGCSDAVMPTALVGQYGHLREASRGGKRDGLGGLGGGAGGAGGAAGGASGAGDSGWQQDLIDQALSYVSCCGDRRLRKSQHQQSGAPPDLSPAAQGPAGPTEVSDLPPSYRAAFYDTVCDASARGGASCLVWMVACPSYQDYDGYTMYARDAQRGPMRGVMRKWVRRPQPQPQVVTL